MLKTKPIRPKTTTKLHLTPARSFAGKIKTTAKRNAIENQKLVKQLINNVKKNPTSSTTSSTTGKSTSTATTATSTAASKSSQQQTNQTNTTNTSNNKKTDPTAGPSHSSQNKPYFSFQISPLVVTSNHLFPITWPNLQRISLRNNN